MKLKLGIRPDTVANHLSMKFCVHEARTDKDRAAQSLSHLDSCGVALNYFDDFSQCQFLFDNSQTM